MDYFCSFHNWHSTGTGMSAGCRWVMVPQGYALLSSNKHRHTLAGKASWEKFASQFVNIACNQALLSLICITAVCRETEAAIIVGSRRLHSKIKALQQEVFHKTLKKGTNSRGKSSYLQKVTQQIRVRATEEVQDC